MLDPDFILRLSEGAEEIASELHADIIRRIVRRVMLRLQRKDDYLLTALDKWQLETLQEAGFLREDLVREIAAATGRQVSEIKRAFEQAGVRTVAWDNRVYQAAGLSPAPLLRSPSLLALLERGYRKTLGEWRNYTGTTAEAAQRLFIEVCDRAYNLVATGAVSYTQAVKEAVERVSRDGVKVTYPTGWTDTIETATLRAVRTGVGQACAEVTEARMEELEWDIVLVSAHLGARYGDGEENFTNHEWWQGKFYSRSGEDKRFPPLEVCGLGEIQGLCGINCRHSMGPGDGVHNPYENFDSEENRARYDLEQKQRAMERRIRKTKREVMGLKEGVDNADPEVKPALEEAHQKKARQLQTQNGEYRQFCADNQLSPLQDRLRIAGWDRKQAASATAAARKTNSINYAKATELFLCDNDNPDAGSITREDILENLERSEVGREVIEHLSSKKAYVKLVYEKTWISNRGEQQGNLIKIFMANNPSPLVAAQTVVHEVTHHKYGIGGCQWAEAVCFAKEKMHLENRTKLSYSELRKIVKLAVDHYPEFKWKRGGYRNGRRF